jgi:hypothetical protein
MSSIVDETPLVPVIQKNEFDDVATEFLIAYCPEALKTPMAVPIMNIARKKLGLIVCTKYRLSEDFSILGQMCFNSGYVDVYLKETDEYIQLTVRRGTMFIDPDVAVLRNQGCFNNTVAHECVHWYKHRNYHLLAHVNDIKKSKKQDALLSSPMRTFRMSGRMRTGWNGRQTALHQEYLCQNICSSKQRTISAGNYLESAIPMF